MGADRDHSPRITAHWYLECRPEGETQREAQAPNLHILCPACGRIWASIINQPPQHHWTCAHVRCQECGIGSLVGADWCSHPYAPLNLPIQLLTRELDIASSNPTRYDP